MMSQAPGMNPYAGNFFDPPMEPAYEETTVPKRIGILNIVFGAILLLCVVGSSLLLLVQGVFGTYTEEQKKQRQAAWEQERWQQIKDLRAELPETQDEETYLRKLKDIETLQEQQPPKIPDMQKLLGMNSPGVMTAYLFDAGSGSLLNVLMLASGVGLVKRRNWARKLAIWVAGFKILRLLLLLLLVIVIVSPAVSEGTANYVAENAQPQAQPSVEQLTQIYSTMFIVWAVLLLIFGSIYPLISWVLLSKPHVVHACKQRPDEVVQTDAI